MVQNKELMKNCMKKPFPSSGIDNASKYVLSRNKIIFDSVFDTNVVIMNGIIMQKMQTNFYLQDS